MMRMNKTIFAALAAVALLAGCKEDLTQEKQGFEATTKEWASKLDGFKKGHADLVAKVTAFELPAGLEALAGLKTGLLDALKATGAAIETAQKAIDSSKASVDAAMQLGKKAPTQAAIDAAKTAVNAALVGVGNALGKHGEAFADLGKQLDAAKAAAAAALATDAGAPAPAH